MATHQDLLTLLTALGFEVVTAKLTRVKAKRADGVRASLTRSRIGAPWTLKAWNRDRSRTVSVRTGERLRIRAELEDHFGTPENVEVEA